MTSRTVYEGRCARCGLDLGLDDGPHGDVHGCADCDPVHDLAAFL